jgi:hypothetical protein
MSLPHLDHPRTVQSKLALLNGLISILHRPRQEPAHGAGSRSRRTRWSCHSEASQGLTHGSMPNAGPLGTKHVEPKRYVRCRPIGVLDDIGTVPHDVVC